jgi:hypothetical protein
MNKLKLIPAFLLISLSIFALDIYEDIANAIRSGDAKQLAGFFDNTIDLSIIDQENVYSKAQAEFVIKDFFSKNPPKAFTIIHKGSSPEGTQYAIGNLITTNGKNLRISFYVKNSGGRSSIQELRIEAQ